MTRLLDAQTVAITMNLAGTFTPNEELYAMSVRAAELNERIVERTKAEGGLRVDVEVDDLSLILEQVSTIRLGDASRTRELRRRYLALFLDGLRTTTGETLPGPAPTPDELAESLVARLGLAGADAREPTRRPGGLPSFIDRRKGSPCVACRRPVHARPARRDLHLVADRAGPLVTGVRHGPVADRRLARRAVDDVDVPGRLPGRARRARLPLARHRHRLRPVQLVRRRLHEPQPDAGGTA